jgi:hypothetical protein
MNGVVALLAVTSGDAYGEVDGLYMYLHNLMNSFSAISHNFGLIGRARTG